MYTIHCTYQLEPTNRVYCCIIHQKNEYIVNQIKLQCTRNFLFAPFSSNKYEWRCRLNKVYVIMRNPEKIHLIIISFIFNGIYRCVFVNKMRIFHEFQIFLTMGVKAFFFFCLQDIGEILSKICRYFNRMRQRI